MVTFKSKSFCVTLNKNSITHILQGKSAIKPNEYSVYLNIEKDLNSSLSNGEVHSLMDLSELNSITHSYGNRLVSSKQKLVDSKLSFTLITIGLVSGLTIDFKCKDLLGIANAIDKKFDNDGHYLAVSDVVNFILYKLDTAEGFLTVDFTEDKVINELYEYSKESITARKVQIAKVITLKSKSFVALTDYLIQYIMSDGKYTKPFEGGKDI